MCCENCEKFHLFDEEAIMIDGSLDGFEIEINGENLSELIKSKIGKRGLI